MRAPAPAGKFDTIVPPCTIDGGEVIRLDSRGTTALALPLRRTPVMRSRRWPSALACAVGLVLVALLAPPVAGYGERVFNENTYRAVGDPFFPVYATADVGQSFNVTETYTLHNVSLFVENVGGGGDRDPLNVTVQTSAAGVPGGRILAGSDNVSAGSSPAWMNFPLTPRPTLLAGTLYWIVARSAEAPGSGCNWVHSNADKVPGYAAQNATGTWVARPTDMLYVTYGIGLEPRIAAAMTVDRFTAPVGGAYAYTVFLNNTGLDAASTVRVNLTLPSEVSYVSDTAGTMGGSKTGPSNWTFPSLANGPHSFGVTVLVGGSARAGSTLTATVHVDYTDPTGVAQPPSTASASILVALEEKPMYLAYDGVLGRTDILQAAEPTGGLGDFDGDGVPGLTLAAGGNFTNATWTLAPAIARPLHLRGPASVILALQSASPPDTVTFTLTLNERGATVTRVASVTAAVTLTSGTTYPWFTFSLGNLDYWVARGSVIELVVVAVAGGTAYLAYNAAAYPSEAVITTETYISVDGTAVRDARGPSPLFSPRDSATVVANVSDPFGVGEIAGVFLSLSDPTGAVLATNATMTLGATDPRTPSAWRLFAYPVPSLQRQGRYTFSVHAVEGNGVLSPTIAGSFLVRAPVLGLAASANLTAVPPLGTVRYTLTVNNTGTGNATAWLNTTLPSGLAYSSDTADALGGVRTGAASWMFATLDPGVHAFDVILRVAGDAADGSHLSLRFDLTYRDEKGFLTAVPPVTSELLVRVGQVVEGSYLGLLILIVVILAAIPIALVLWRRRHGTIEEAFLVLQSGLLLCHLSRRMRVAQDKDHDVLGGMLTAIQNFVRDSFRYGENRSLERLEFGDYRVLIEHGKWVYLAIAVSGHEPPGLRKEMKAMVKEVEEKYDTDLENFDGWMEPLLGVRDILARMMKAA